jgi:hypothetical protein
VTAPVVGIPMLMCHMMSCRQLKGWSCTGIVSCSEWYVLGRHFREPVLMRGTIRGGHLC